LENELTLSESLKETGEEFIKRRNMIPLGFTDVEKKSIFTLLKRWPERYYSSTGVDYVKLHRDLSQPKAKGFFKRTVADLTSILEGFLAKRQLKDARMEINKVVFPFLIALQSTPLTNEQDDVLELVHNGNIHEMDEAVGAVVEFNEVVAEIVATGEEATISPIKVADLMLNTRWQQQFEKPIDALKVFNKSEA
jgi:hypothetical protein